eukprot:CAMPEP_0204564126 /NCGR_PEP_ID=MMETSP0661-20131031/34707_1 /ASSEMBLY_ACC=CAM_ASM_000606 /TAXON_ID=109239 /ORGANISM="Alexandrium margalefi, Strain AMGDE01CS-322" /LENGTH=305 /DNA_ID=CAMNT_0051571747 /DNA_START=67 /DNA_END=981 /DNA_ORIENTATION=+
MARRSARLVGLAALGLGALAHSAGDSQALLQTDLQTSQGQVLQQLRETSLHGRMGLLAKLAAVMPEGTEQDRKPKQGKRRSFDCTKFPDFCREPFNCQEGLDPFRLSIAQQGRANLHSWCSDTAYYPYMTTCMQQRDPVKAAKIQYAWSVAQKRGIEEMDGSYCFIEGHCTNEAVTANTTLEEAEKMCDARYGHGGWTGWTPLEEPRALLSLALFGKYAASATTGFHDCKLTRVFLKMACAMGNYHCDVMYCKETYCKNEYYVSKYGHLQPETPGTSCGSASGRSERPPPRAVPRRTRAGGAGMA